MTAIVIGGFVISRGLDDPADTSAGEPEASEIDPAAAGGETVTGVDDGTDDAMGTEDDTGSTGSTMVTADDGTGTASEVLPGGSATDSSTAAGGTAADGSTATEDTMAATTTTVLTGPRPAAEVRVLILNGAGTQGIAAMGTETVEAAGYPTAFPKNADSLRPSAILYVEGYQFDAEAVAAVFSAGLESIVAPLDDTTRPIDDIQGAQVIVVVGNDGAIPIS